MGSVEAIRTPSEMMKKWSRPQQFNRIGYRNIEWYAKPRVDGLSPSWGTTVLDFGFHGISFLEFLFYG